MVKFLFEFVQLIINMVNEQMIEDIKYMNAMKEYFRIFVVHNSKDKLKTFPNQEPMKFIFKIINIISK